MNYQTGMVTTKHKWELLNMGGYYEARHGRDLLDMDGNY